MIGAVILLSVLYLLNIVGAAWMLNALLTAGIMLHITMLPLSYLRRHWGTLVLSAILLIVYTGLLLTRIF